MVHDSRVIAIYQILLGWKIDQDFYETDELPKPRPTQPKTIQVKGGTEATVSHSKIIFRGLGIGFK